MNPSQAEESVVNYSADLKQREYEIIVEALNEAGGSKKHAAEKLGISPRTLRYKMAKMREDGLVVD
jgi:two-component system response regulator FlrC